MTNDIVKQITEAELQATACKQKAEETARQTLVNAEERAMQLLRSAEEVCKAYEESQRKTAVATAEERYNQALNSASQQAKSYCAEVLSKAEPCVSEIVGRVVHGDC